jgi:hypothetical protein
MFQAGEVVITVSRWCPTPDDAVNRAAETQPWISGGATTLGFRS